MQSYDAIIIGSGPNALVNAAYLTRAGWSVLMLEKNDRPGGGVRTEELTLPGFHHDLYAGFFILFALSQANAEFGAALAERGLKLVPTTMPTGVSMPGGKATVLTTNMEANVAEAERLAPGDGAAWGQMLQSIGQHAQLVFGLLNSDLTAPQSTAMIQQLMLAEDGKSLSPFAGEFLMTARDLLESTFQSEVWRGVLAPWILHSGHGPEDANGALWLKIFAMATQSAGQFVAVGGSEMLARAFVQLIRDQGGTVLTNTKVSRILAEGGKAIGVRTESGDEYRANRAVIATANPDQLYQELLADTDVVPPLVRQQAGKFRYGHAVFFVHLALNEPPRWHDERLNNVVYTHITDGLDGVSRNFNETTRRLLPAEPVIGVGTPSLLDPSRAPAGKAVMVLQGVDMPFQVVGDAAGTIDVGDGTWTEDLKNRFADRMIEIASRHIPNLSGAILARSIVSPLDLHRYNPNWKYGDPFSGSHALAQSFLLRPLAAQPGYRTVIPNLYMIGAATHPGLGLGAGSGYIVAQHLLRTE